MSFHLSPSAHTTHTHTQCGLGEMLSQPLLTPHSRVFSWPTLRVTTRVSDTSTQTIVFIASTHRLPPARDDSPQSFYKHTTNISYHSGETLRSVRHPRFQPPPARHDRDTVLASPNQSTTARCISRSSSSFQAIDDSTLSRSRGPSSIHVPSNRRQQTILVFQAIDESTKSSPSKQSTRAQSLRLPSNRRQQTILVFQAIDVTRAQSLRLSSNRRAFLHQHTERRAATTIERQLAASTAQ